MLSSLGDWGGHDKLEGMNHPPYPNTVKVFLPCNTFKPLTLKGGDCSLLLIHLADKESIKAGTGTVMRVLV